MSFEIFTTDTSEWTLAIHRVTATTAEVWVGTLFPTLKMPNQAKVELIGPDGQSQVQNIVRADWQRPFRYMRQRFFKVCVFENLQPGTRYEARFFRFVESVAGIMPDFWQDLRSGYFDTLPSRVPGPDEKPFVIGLASCFFRNRDGGHAASSYKAMYERAVDAARPDITFMTGDQVYLDIGFDSLSFIPSEIRQRIANDYAENWRSLGSFLNRGGTWMLPDDHEYWNDYPFYDSLLPTLLALKIDSVRRAWTKAAKDAVQNIQRAKAIDIFSLGDDLSICVADLRTYRSKRGFIGKQDFAKLVEWATNLEGPGVLVIPQPLIVEENKLERNLMSWPQQYGELIKALGSSGHDVVVLSGDVHFGRIATVPLGDKGGRLIEVIASPLSNLTGLNGFATSVWKNTPKKFPDPNSIKVPGLLAQAVNYDRTFRVSTRKGHPLSFVYPRERTSEHFMTVAFSRPASGGISLSVDAWRVRERGKNNLPVKDFSKKFALKLK
ncbi:MAG: hypothetical protein P1U67_01235 [Alcanivoracaceae bacterium]|nr:hypothetical protein [Alcanivoracaceae bacterium]